MVFELISRKNRTLTFLLNSRCLRFLSSSLPHRSRLRDHYGFVPPESLLPPNPNPSSGDWNNNRKKKKKPPYQPPSSLDRAGKDPLHSDLPFDFRFSYTESSPAVKPIGLREPKYSPFGPGRVDRTWIGHCAPAVDPTVRSVDVDEPPLAMDEEKWRRKREKILGAPLTKVEREQLVDQFQKYRSKRQINLGRDGLTHNMLNDVHNSWKNAEAVRIKCLGVPTVDMKNVCMQLEDKTGGLIIHRHGGQIILYRGRHYNPKRRPVIPLMLWKPREPIYPRLIKTVIDGLTIEETKEMRKRGLAVPALTKLAKNGYYASLVPMVRDAFLTDELVRIDCKGFEKSDYRKIGCKLKDLVPCNLVTFDKEQIVVWRGKNYDSTMDPDPGEKSDTPPVYNSEEESSGDDQTGEKSNSPVYNSEEGSCDFSDQSSASFTSDYSSSDESQDEGTRTGL